jgi:hypothetical protein
MLRIQTSFQDTPGDGYYFVLLYQGRELSTQLDELGLKHGDTVLLWEPDCGDYIVEATLLFNYQHPMLLEPSTTLADLSLNRIPESGFQ